MGLQENDDESVNFLEVQHEIGEEEPIEQVFSQEAEDISTIEPSIESEVQEEEIEAPKVEPKPVRDKVRKLKTTRNTPNKSESISQIEDELRKHSNARNKIDFAFLNIRQGLMDLKLVYQVTIKDLQKQVSQIQRKLATIEKSRKSTKIKASVKKKSSNTKSKKKNSQKKQGTTVTEK
jgi:hypothetical protein